MQECLRASSYNAGRMNADTTPPADARAAAPGTQRQRPNDRRRGPQRQRAIHPVLEQLASLHPALFGARFRPLKLGTFHDLIARHPGVFEPAALKEALGQHARSTRYLDCLARGEDRHDLDGQPVSPLALEHRHHAIVELFKRRQARSKDDVQPVMRAQLRALFVSSGLDRAGYAAAARVQPDALDALLDLADQDQAAEIARREAMLRAFELSGVAEPAFADQYGLSPQTVSQMLADARDDRRIRAAR